MRSNKDWINELTGKKGTHYQHRALHDLSSHLHTVAYNQLRKVRGSKAALGDLAPDELTDIAADFVQDTIEKITLENFALLEKYKHIGSFEAWTATVITRIVSSELRRPYWARRKTISLAQEKRQRDDAPLPEETALVNAAMQAANDCIRQLPERRRVIFIRSTLEDESAEELAEEFETSANAIHILNYRSREKLRQCLEKRVTAKTH